MTKSIVVSVAVLTLSASAAFAAHHHHHRHGMSPVAEGMAQAAPPAGEMDSGQTQYMKNLHDSGYNPKDDYTKTGIMRDH